MNAPTFSLPDQNGTLRSLNEYRGKWVVLYFYPKDDTPGCTKEACTFRDAIATFQKLGVEIVGVSKDSVSSHKKFADKYHLNFSLLSDESHETIKSYGSWGEKKFMGRVFEGTLRNTYLIDPNGVIVKTYEKVNPLVHAEGVLHDLTELRGKSNK